MLRKVVVTLATAVALTVGSTASASPLNITNIVGDWLAGSVVPLGGAAIVNAAGQGTDTIRWPAAGGSGADFTPAANIIGVTLGTPFSLGTFVHHNFPTGGTITDVDYSFSFDTNGAPANLSDTFHLAVNDTPNATPCAPGSISVCDDYITVSSLAFNSLIIVGGDTYFFSILGFSTNGGATISNVFQTQEGLANTSQLYAVVTAERITAVPEPGTLLLVGGALALASRRFLRKR